MKKEFLDYIEDIIEAMNEAPNCSFRTMQSAIITHFG